MFVKGVEHNGEARTLDGGLHLMLRIALYIAYCHKIKLPGGTS